MGFGWFACRPRDEPLARDPGGPAWFWVCLALLAGLFGAYLTTVL